MQSISDDNKRQIREFVGQLGHDQLIWLNGFTEGLLDVRSSEQIGSGSLSQISTPAIGSKKLKVLFGSHSGNSKKVAAQVAAEAQKLGIESSVEDMSSYNVRKIKEEEQLIVIVSTHGEGEPPVAAEELHQFLSGKKAPKLNGLPYAVIALGDSAYKKFCQTGIDFYEFLKKQGGQPVGDVVTLDVDFAGKLSQVIPSLFSKFLGSGTLPVNSQPLANSYSAPVDEVVEAPVLERIQLNGRGSGKETWHIEVGIEDTGLKYEPGDALEIYPANSRQLVADIINQLDLTATDRVEVDGEQISLAEALIHHFELTVVTPQVFKKYVAYVQSSEVEKLLNDPDLLEQYLFGADVLDLIKEFPVRIPAGEFIQILRKLPPRLYSISSSQASVGDEVHITVGAVRYEKNSRKREGVCSTFLADRLGADENLKVKVRPNLQFRLPNKQDTPVIMIGAGTGIAPFRAFLQHREATGAAGRNWLVFGDQHFDTDFLYQAEWLKYRKEGLLTRMDVAFSRDQQEKIYVQNRLAENSSELYKWLSEGAHLYVCGDMKKMAKDVKQTLQQILEKEAGLSTEQASDYLKQLKKEGRYQEDVY